MFQELLKSTLAVLWNINLIPLEYKPDPDPPLGSFHQNIETSQHPCGTPWQNQGQCLRQSPGFLTLTEKYKEGGKKF